MSHLQSRVYAAIEEAQRARRKKREAADALRARQHEYETANLRGRQKQITRARAALEAAQAGARAFSSRFPEKTPRTVTASPCRQAHDAANPRRLGSSATGNRRRLA